MAAPASRMARGDGGWRMLPLLLLLCATPARAQDSLESCRPVAEPAERLACYDRLATAALATPVAMPAPMTGAWQAHQSFDSLTERRRITLSVPAEGRPHRSLVVQCFGGRLDIYVNAFSPMATEVEIRFDSLEWSLQIWRESRRADAMLAPNPQPLLQRMTRAQLLTYRMLEGNSTLTELRFPIAGLATLVPQLSSCLPQPAPPPPPRRPPPVRRQATTY